MNLTGRQPYQKGQKPAKVPALRNDARNRDCTLRLPGVCTHDPAKTVGSHISLFGFAGMAGKADDIFILDACDRCHDVLDHRDKWASCGLNYEVILMAFMATLRNRRASGLITLKGE